MNCLRNKLLFHNHYLIYEGDYNEFKSNAFWGYICLCRKI
jgi:hypothetical protein